MPGQGPDVWRWCVLLSGLQTPCPSASAGSVGESQPPPGLGFSSPEGASLLHVGQDFGSQRLQKGRMSWSMFKSGARLAGFGHSVPAGLLFWLVPLGCFWQREDDGEIWWEKG